MDKLIAYQTVDREGDIWCNTALLFHSDEQAITFFKDKEKVFESLNLELDEEETFEDIEFTYYGAEGCAPNQISFYYGGDVRICAMSKGFVIQEADAEGEVEHFKIPIGDWSNDGHGECEYFTASTEKTFKDVVLAYIEMDKQYGLSNLCKDYDDCEILEDARDDFQTLTGIDLWRYLAESPVVNPDEMVNMVVACLNNYDPSLNVVLSREIPILHNWAALKIIGEESGRFLSLPGYGLFS